MSFKINDDQFRLLEGFFLHCWYAYHENEALDAESWAWLLDRAKIKWSIQNNVSYLASKRENKFLYFRNILNGAGIQIV